MSTQRDDFQGQSVALTFVKAVLSTQHTLTNGVEYSMQMVHGVAKLVILGASNDGTHHQLMYGLMLQECQDIVAF